MILVTGAKGVVGKPLCERLANEHRPYLEVSRRASNTSVQLQWDLNNPPSKETQTQLAQASSLIHCAPIWLLPAHLSLLIELGLKRLVVFSSTSVLSKFKSENSIERHLVNQLRDSEEHLIEHCRSSDIQLTIIRPSLIYGYGRDENISHIARFIQRYGFMVLVGKATGLRQPVHSDDLVELALNCLQSTLTEPSTYNVAGKDVISYREMVQRIFVGLERRPIILSVPLWIFKPALIIAAKLSRFSYTPEMATRMSQNLNYDYSDAVNDLGFSPQGFLEQPQRDLIR